MSGKISQSTLLRFLDALLPNEGYRCAFFAKNGKHQQAFFEDNQTLAAALLAGDEKGFDSYQACATFKTNRSRKAENVQAVKAFWLDIDCGEGKPYAGKNEALYALQNFIQDRKLVQPCVVYSGSGIHVYWFLRKETTAIIWSRYAQGLKRICQRQGLIADPSRTSDESSILRPPNTHNRKNGLVRLVEIGQFNGPYDLEQFNVFLDAAPPLRPTKSNSIAATLQNICLEEPSDPERVAEGCAQLRAMRDTGGRLQEPLWKACLGVLAFCDNGENIAHEWSFGDIRYDEAETQKKFDLSRQLGNPITCSHFQGIEPGRCSGCPHLGKITTPVQLGREKQSWAASPELSVASTATQRWGEFELLSNGQLIRHGDKGGKYAQVLVSRQGFHLTSISRGELNSKAMHISCQFYVGAEQAWTTLNFPVEKILGEKGISMLAGAGVLTDDPNMFRLYIREAMYKLMNEHVGHMYEQGGWKENDSAFLIGDKLFGPDGIRRVPVATDLTYRSKYLCPKIGGSLNGWKQYAEQLFGLGREAQTFAMLAGFGAIFIKFLAPREGGAIVSLVSRGGAKGKSTALAGVSSLWGDGRGLKLTNGISNVAAGLYIGALGNLPIVWDELASPPDQPEWLSNFVRMFTDGMDKARGTAEGKLIQQQVTWQTILITASNTSLIDKIKASGGTTAPADRILELEMAPLEGGQKGDRMMNGLNDNWGYAGEVFLNYIVQPAVLPRVKQMLVDWQEQLIKQHDFKPEHRFWTRTLTCVAVAGFFAAHLGLIEFPPSMILDFAVDQLKSRSNNLTTPEIGNDSALTVLANFLHEQIDKTVVVPFAGRQMQIPSLIPRGLLNVRIEKEIETAFISEKVVLRYLSKHDFSLGSFKKELSQSGVLKGVVNKSLGWGTNLPTGLVSCLEVDVGHPKLSGMMRIVAIAERKPA